MTDPNGSHDHHRRCQPDEPLSGPGYGNKCPDARQAGATSSCARAVGRVTAGCTRSVHGLRRSRRLCSGTVTVVPHDQAITSARQRHRDSFGPRPAERGDRGGFTLGHRRFGWGAGILLARGLFGLRHGRRLAVLVSSQQTQGAPAELGHRVARGPTTCGSNADRTWYGGSCSCASKPTVRPEFAGCVKGTLRSPSRSAGLPPWPA